MGILTDRLDKCLVGVMWEGDMDSSLRYKAYTNLIGTPEYHYNITNDILWLPLQYGNGEYTVRLFGETAPRTGKYTMQEQKHVHAYAEDPLTVFLQPNCYHDWNHNMGCIKQAAAITASIGADMAKAEAVWLYIVSNFKYDAAFATEITAAGGKYNYSPDLESIYVDKSGICFGLSALYNSMLRSQGIPARMCHGYVNNIYHAWSEVWFYNKWVHVDTTFDMTSGKWVDGFLNYVISPDKYETKFIY